MLAIRRHAVEQVYCPTPIFEMIGAVNPRGNGSQCMTISSLTLYKVAVPLKRVVRHASFERTESENLIVRVTLSDGTTGYGEGVPRSYVTGETVDSTFSGSRGRRLGARSSAGRRASPKSSSGWRG